MQGNVYYANDGNPARMLGTLLDITQVKRLEQQKDDFISIASHELKTPITSLKASLQLLDKLKKNEANPVSAKLIEQSLKSMGKTNQSIIYQIHFRFLLILKNKWHMILDRFLR